MNFTYCKSCEISQRNAVIKLAEAETKFNFILHKQATQDNNSSSRKESRSGQVLRNLFLIDTNSSAVPKVALLAHSTIHNVDFEKRSENSETA